MQFAGWQAQLRKGAAELVVLCLLAERELYGLQLLELANAGGDLVTDGALYPLLARLEADGKIEARWALDDRPHPRKYYRLTETGDAARVAMTEAWTAFRIAMTALVETRP